MELDELKKSWDILNEQLSNSELINKEQVSTLIKLRSTKAHTGLKNIANWGKVSLLTGVVAIVGIGVLLGCYGLPMLGLPPNATERIQALGSFFLPSIVFGIWWDSKTLLWVVNTNIEEMPILTVIERMNRFRSWLKIEIVAMTIWLLGLFSLVYVIYDIYTYSVLTQTILIIVQLLLPTVIVYLFYKKLIYDNLEIVEKNIAEIKELDINE